MALFFADKDAQTIQSVLQEQLKVLGTWFTENALIVNCSKTKVICFGTKQSLSGTPLELTTTVKYLGLSFDVNLNWHNHFDSVASKVSGRLHLLARIRKYLNMDTCKYLHGTLIQPLY